MPKHAKSFAVIGIGRFGASVAQTLCTLGHEVLAIDRDETRIAAIADLVTHAVVADTRMSARSNASEYAISIASSSA